MQEVVNQQASLSELLCCVIEDPKTNIDGILGNFSKYDAFMKRLCQVSQKFNALPRK
jgi:hypothetical protein